MIHLKPKPKRRKLLEVCFVELFGLIIIITSINTLTLQVQLEVEAVVLEAEADEVVEDEEEEGDSKVIISFPEYSANWIR